MAPTPRIVYSSVVIEKCDVMYYSHLICISRFALIMIKLTKFKQIPSFFHIPIPLYLWLTAPRGATPVN